MMWKAGTQPDQIVDEEGEHVGFADAGWAEQIIKVHNAAIRKQGGKEDASTPATINFPTSRN